MKYFKFPTLNSVLAFPPNAAPKANAHAFAWTRGARLYGMVLAVPGSPGAIENPARRGEWAICFVGHVRAGVIVWAVRCRVWPAWANADQTPNEVEHTSLYAGTTHLARDRVVKLTGAGHAQACQRVLGAAVIAA